MRLYKRIAVCAVCVGVVGVCVLSILSVLELQGLVEILGPALHAVFRVLGV